MIRIILINPDTNNATTQAMLEVAQQAAGKLASLDGLTARFGRQLAKEPSKNNFNNCYRMPMMRGWTTPRL